MPKPTMFGRYIRQKRNEAQLSLRDVADKLGVSYVYLGEVERGVRGPIRKERWQDLVKAIPGVKLKALKNAAEASKPVLFDLNDARPQYRNLALALAREMKDESLTDEEIRKILSILGESKSD
jgi:transcriptional regulator with XRE-family HTH domain